MTTASATMQTNRILEAKIAGLNPAYQLVLTEISGFEAISEAYEFKLTLKTQNNIPNNELLGKPVSFRVKNPDDPNELKQFHGWILKSEYNSATDSRSYKTYTVTVGPWFSLFNLTSDCRIFENLSAPEIFTTMCTEIGYPDYQLKLTQTYDKLPYEVQFNESGFDFIERILSEAGIFFYFEYYADKHIMVLADQAVGLPLTSENIVHYNQGHHQAHLHRWQPGWSLNTNKITQLDYNYRNPNANMTASTQNVSQPHSVLGVSNFERFSYPGYFQKQSQGTGFTNQRMAADNWQSQLIHAEGNYFTLSPASRFKLSYHEDAQQEGQYLITEMRHEAHDYSYFDGRRPVKSAQEVEREYQMVTPLAQRSPEVLAKLQAKEQAKQHEPVQQYVNSIDCIPVTVPFAPIQHIPRPEIAGVQTAIVVSTSETAPYSDKYLRAKVIFHWDRIGDMASACWIRVAPAFAGGDHGMQFIPRPGQEVIIEFEHGDPSRPIITGFVYNADNPPPFQLPEEQNISGIKTRTVGSKDAADGSEISFNDTKGQEAFKLYTSGTLKRTAKGSELVTIGNDYHHIVTGNQTVTSHDKVIISAQDELIIMAGSSEIILNAGGVTIKAPQVSMGMPGTAAALPPKVPTYIPPTGQATGQTIQDQDKQTQDVYVELLYETETRTFYALTEKEYEAFETELVPELQAPIQAAVIAYNQQVQPATTAVANVAATKARQEVIDKALTKLNAKLKPLVHGKGNNDLAELAQMGHRKWSYVDRKKIKKTWSYYKVSKKPDLEKISTKGQLDHKKLAKLLSQSKDFEFSQQKNWSGAVTNWAKEVNQNANFETTVFGADGKPAFTADADAKLLRYTAGVSSHEVFNPKQGKVNFSADGEASLDIASARTNMAGCIPSEAGWPLIFHPVDPDTNAVKQAVTIDFGAIRFYSDVELYAFAGASAMASVNLNFALDPDSGAVKVKGTNKKQKPNSIEETEVGVSAFAGAKAGCDLAVALQWQNPDRSMAWLEFCDMDASGAGEAGIGADFEFYVRYYPHLSKFIVYAKAGVVCGVGASGHVAFAVDVKHIEEFVAFVYHKIMNYNYRYIGFLTEDAMEAITRLFMNAVYSGLENLGDMVATEFQKIAGWWEQFAYNFVEDIKKREKVDTLATNIINNPGIVKYMPPEAKGRLLYMLSDVWFDAGQQEHAILLVLCYIQSRSEYDNVMQRMSLKQGEKISIEAGEKKLYSGLGMGGRSMLADFKGRLDDENDKIIYPANINSEDTPRQVKNLVNEIQQQSSWIFG